MISLLTNFQFLPPIHTSYQRGLFIIDPTGQLRQITCNDLPVGRNVDEIIRLIKAFQFVEEHGEVCPANWQPGDVTMQADPVKSLAYFQAVNPASGSSGSGSSIEEVSDAAVFASLTKAAGVTVVKYWAPWCKNCKKIDPVINKLASGLPAVKFISVDTTKAESIGDDNKVDALPTVQFFKAGSKIGEFKGSDAAKLEQAIFDHTK